MAESNRKWVLKSRPRGMVDRAQRARRRREILAAAARDADRGSREDVRRLRRPASLVGRSGWRSVSVVVAGTLLVVIPIVFLVVRDRPSDLGLLPYGASPDDPPVALPQTNPLARSARSPAPPASATSPGSGSLLPRAANYS